MNQWIVHYHHKACFTNRLVFLDTFLGLSFLPPSPSYEPLQDRDPIRNFCCPQWRPGQNHWQSSCSVNSYSSIGCLKGPAYKDCPSSLLCFTTFSNLLVFLPVFLRCHHTFFHCSYLWEREIIQKHLYLCSQINVVDSGFILYYSYHLTNYQEGYKSQRVFFLFLEIQVLFFQKTPNS